MELKPGDKAPKFRLATDGGGEVSSTSLKGKPYVLYFYPKDDTSGCTREAIGFSESLKKFEARSVAVIGVSKDSTTSHDRFKTKYKLKVVLGSDPETKMAAEYGVWVEKSMYGRKYMGMERATFLVDDSGVILNVWRKVKVDGHVDEVLAAAKKARMKPHQPSLGIGPRLTSRSFFWGKSLIRRRHLSEMRPVGFSVKDASKGNVGMAGTLVERVWAWLHETFPERQIYIRSDGRVQFFTFGPTLQATLAGLSLIFLGWVAFATVNVIFKDRIISAKDSRYQQMQSAYENRVADLQLSYDELNGALVSAEDRFTATANELQTKQNTIMHFLDRRRQVNSTIAGLTNTGVRTGAGAAPADAGDSGAPSNSIDNAPPPSGAVPIDAGGASELTVLPQPPAPQPRTAKPTKASFLDFGGAVDHLTGLLFGSKQTGPAAPTSATLVQHPALRVLAEQTTRVAQIGLIKTQLMTRTQNEVADGVTSIQNVIRHTGINPDDYTHRLAAAEGVGGPDIPLNDVQVEGIADQAFSNAYLRASAVLDQMNTLLTAMRHIPLTTPVSGSQFERTSGFGPRIDPFTGHYSFHPGVDFAGPWGSIIASTAPGTVVYAGDRGGYGNMVEIDHGFGIHTRYGHMSSILVHIGSKVGKGSPIGRLGSTGRSTGPHVHYEVWYDNVVRNPSTFIEAGRHVFE